MSRLEMTQEMISYLAGFIPGHTEQEIREAFNQEFGIVLTKSQIKNFKTRHGIKSGTTGGRFQPGHVSHNKGKKMSKEVYERIKPTMFKPGNKPVNYKPVGSERVSVDGYVEIKIAEPNKWALKHRIVYEEYHHEKLKPGDVVIMLDGNKTNLDPDNLRKLTRAELIRYNQDRLHGDNPEINKVAVTIAKLEALQGIRKRREDK